MENLSETILRELKEIKSLVTLQNLVAKQTLNLDEAATYMAISKSTLYKLTSTNKIICYRPTGRLIYFKKVDLDNFLLQGKQITLEEAMELPVAGIRKPVLK